MPEKAVVFELTANTREVSLPGGKVLKPGDSHRTTDPDEIDLLRATKGLKEQERSSSTKGGK